MPDSTLKIKYKYQLNPLEEKNFFKAIALSRDLNRLERAIASFIFARYFAGTGDCADTQETIAERTGYSPQKVREAIKSLETKGVLIVTRQWDETAGKRHNRYAPIISWAVEQLAKLKSNTRGMASETADIMPSETADINAMPSVTAADVVRNGRRCSQKLPSMQSVTAVNKSRTVSTELEEQNSKKSAFGDLPADSSDRRSVNDESRYSYDDESGPEYQPGGEWYEFDHNPLGDINLRNEYYEILNRYWSGSDQPENLNRYMELRRSGVPLDRIELASGEVNGEVTLPEFLTGAWKHFDPSECSFDDMESYHDVRRESDVDWDNDPPF